MCCPIDIHGIQNQSLSHNKRYNKSDNVECYFFSEIYLMCL